MQDYKPKYNHYCSLYFLKNTLDFPSWLIPREQKDLEMLIDNLFENLTTEEMIITKLYYHLIDYFSVEEISNKLQKEKAKVIMKEKISIRKILDYCVFEGILNPRKSLKNIKK